MIHSIVFFSLALMSSPWTQDGTIAEQSVSQEDVPESVSLDEVELISPEGKTVRLADFNTAPHLLVVFLGTECPIAKLSVPKLNQIRDQFAAEELAIVAVDPNRQDSLEEVAAFARRSDASFPMLKDVGNKLADQFAATRTPETFLLDREGKIHYRGQIDDQYGVGYARSAAKQTFLMDALKSLRGGEPIAVSRTEAIGCLIGRTAKVRTDGSVTYSNRVADILNRNCVECHREGQIAPFPVTDYEDAAGWADMIAEVVRDGRMPPWSADRSIEGFENARGLTEEEKQDLYHWADAGAPLGDLSEIPEPPKFVAGWRTSREPDLVFRMSERPYLVPAEGTVEYEYFLVDPKFTEDQWVQAAEVVPGNSRVVHHAIVFFRDPQAAGEDHLGWIAAYVPGQEPMELAAGQARRIPAGARLIFQLHYTPTGRPVEDVTRIGLCLVDEDSVEREVITIGAFNRDFVIPPGAADFAVTTRLNGFPEGSHLLAAAPHMHLRGKSFELILHGDDDASAKRLLSVPQYDFNWQHLYRFEDPPRLDASISVECVTRFDNSADNLANPDPAASVRWGDQTWQEMAVTFFDLALPEGQSSAELSLTRNEERKDRNKQALDVAERFVNRFDRNGDEAVTRSEVPEAFAAFAFRRYDANRDGLITSPEVFKQILREGE